MTGECGTMLFTAEELEIFKRLRELRREFRALQAAPVTDGEDAAAREQRLAQLRTEWGQWKRKSERARSRRMYFLGHSELLDADSIE